MAWWLSFISLCIVVVICCLGLYSSKFKDNLFQCVAMVFLLWASFTRIHSIFKSGYVDATGTLFHVGIALYAIGVVIKVTLYTGREERWHIVTKIDSAFDDWKRSIRPAEH